LQWWRIIIWCGEKSLLTQKSPPPTYVGWRRLITGAVVYFYKLNPSNWNPLKAPKKVKEVEMTELKPVKNKQLFNME
jgi:hypothetical protein